MIFLNSNYLSGNISKMAELSDAYVINGQIYDKNMIPKALQTLPIESTTDVEINLYTTAYTNTRSNSGSSRINKSLIVDNNNSNICYKVIQNYNSTNRGAYLAKITDSDGQFSIQKGTLLSSGSDTLDIISQDSTNVYCKYSIISTSYVLAINKNTLNHISTGISYVSMNNIIFENDLYLYTWNYSWSPSAIYLYKVEKSTMNKTLLYTYSLGSAFSITNVVNVSNTTPGKFYSIIDGYATTQKHQFLYKKYIFDSVFETISESTINIDYNNLVDDYIEIYQNSYYYSLCNELLEYTDSDGKKYITHFIYNQGTGVFSAENSAMYTYEMIDSDNWKLVNYTLFTPVIYKAILPVYNNSIIFAIYGNGYSMYVWDSVTKQYIESASSSETITAAGIDMNNNIYIQKGDSRVDIISKTVPSTIFADFEEDSYEYNGVDISSNIIVYAKNMENKFINTNLELKLSGNVVFTDTGLQKKSISTSNLGKLTIPVTITDSSMLRVSVSIK